MIFSDVVEKQLCVVFPFLERISVTACCTETGSSGLQSCKTQRCQAGHWPHRSTGKMCFWHTARRNELSSSTAHSCAEPSSPPTALKTQHMCKVINSYRLTLETKWTGTELENTSAKKQWTGSNEGQSAALPHSLCTQVCVHTWPHRIKYNPVLPS